MAKSGAERAAPTRGRPKGGTTYRPEHAETARLMCRGGAIDTELAAAFGVDERTVNRWRLAHPEFAAALDGGKTIANEKVERALFERAMGYSHAAQKFFVIDGKVVTVNYTEHYPPDTGACAFFLKNRDPKNWRDKHELDVPGLGDLADALESATRRVNALDASRKRDR